MERLGKNGLPRMVGVSATGGKRLRRVLTNGGLWCARGREHHRKIRGRSVPGNFGVGCRGNRVRSRKIPDGRRVGDQNGLEDDGRGESRPWEFRLNPAVAEIRVAFKLLRSSPPSNESHQAGEELLARSRSLDRQARGGQRRRRVERNAFARPLMQMSDLKQPDGPLQDYTPGRTGFLPRAWRSLVGQVPLIPCIRSSALSRDTSGFASHDRSQGRPRSGRSSPDP